MQWHSQNTFLSALCLQCNYVGLYRILIEGSLYQNIIPLLLRAFPNSSRSIVIPNSFIYNKSSKINTRQCRGSMVEIVTFIWMINGKQDVMINKSRFSKGRYFYFSKGKEKDSGARKKIF